MLLRRKHQAALMPDAACLPCSPNIIWNHCKDAVRAPTVLHLDERSHVSGVCYKPAHVIPHAKPSDALADQASPCAGLRLGHGPVANAVRGEQVNLEPLLLVRLSPPLEHGTYLDLRPSEASLRCTVASWLPPGWTVCLR